MDPEKAWSDLSRAVIANQWQEAAEIAEELTDCLSRGGFPPRITGNQFIDRLVVNAACQMIATWELV